jgi:hypothetical protein
MEEKKKEQNSITKGRQKIHELMNMPPKKRYQVLRAQTKEAADYYKSDPDLDLSGDEDIVEY